MNRLADIPQEDLHALVDGELSVDEKSRLLALSRDDDELTSELCKLRQLKEMVRNAYEAPPQPEPDESGGDTPRRGWLAHALAALLLVTLSGLGGWYAHGLTYGDRLASAGQPRVLVQLDTNDAKRAMAALTKARDYIGAYGKSTSTPVKVEIVAYGKGLDLIRKNGSRQAQAVLSMAQQLGNVSLVACRQAIREAKAKGVDVKLLPGIGTVPRALDEIVNRLNEGWHDIRA